MNVTQMSDLFGVPERVVEGWVHREGLPHTRDAGRLLFDPRQVAEWATRHGLVQKAAALTPRASEPATGLRLGALLRVGGIWRDVRASEVTEAFVRVATSLPRETPAVRAWLASRLRAPGGVSLAPIGEGLALPHPSARVTLGRGAGALALIRLADPLPPPDPRVDDVPIRTLAFLLAPSPRAHLEMLGRVARLLTRGALGEALACGATDAEILRLVDAADAAAAGAAASGAKP